MEETIILNLEGEICPYTLIYTLKKLEEVKQDLEKGKILEIFYDHPPVVENIPLEVSKRGFTCEVEKVSSGKWKISIKK
jgi:TusA-related sulfurtransferase